MCRVPGVECRVIIKPQSARSHPSTWILTLLVFLGNSWIRLILTMTGHEFPLAVEVVPVPRRRPTGQGRGSDSDSQWCAGALGSSKQVAAVAEILPGPALKLGGRGTGDDHRLRIIPGNPIPLTPPRRLVRV